MISVAAFGEAGDGTFYRELLPGTTNTPTVTAFEPYRAPSSTVGVGLGLEQGLGAGFSVDVGASLRRTTTPDGAQTGPALSASVVWRWD